MPQLLCKLAFALILAASVSGCAVLKCAPENCAADAKITADVRQVFGQHTEFGVAPAELTVQTINGVVYLNGRVNTVLMRRNAEALVRQVPNVKNVVNSLRTAAT
jgi:osmotically-inducible protein OsmY